MEPMIRLTSVQEDVDRPGEAAELRPCREQDRSRAPSLNQVGSTPQVCSGQIGFFFVSW